MAVNNQKLLFMGLWRLASFPCSCVGMHIL